MILQCLLDEAQEMLLVHTGCCVDVCVHLPSHIEANYIYASLKQLQKVADFSKSPAHALKL
jgi:hypothetical protein